MNGMSQNSPSSTPAISVTMAAFNVASYIEASLDSVLAQSFADFELIIVDDGSSDETPAILQDYARRDARIRLILKEHNEGLAVARNQAVATARGQWLTFLDADDLYHPEMLELALNAAHAANAEMVIWDYVVFSNEAQIPAKVAVHSGLQSIDSSDRKALLVRPAFAWTRLVHRDALKRLNINFPRGLTYQDFPVHWRLVTQLDRIALLPRRLSYYRQQPEATTAGKGIKRADYFIVLDQVEAFLHESGQFDTYDDLLTGHQLNAWHGVYDVIAQSHEATVSQMIADRFTDRHSAYLAAGKPLRWQARAFFRATEGSQLDALALYIRNTVRAFYRAIKSRL
ncbi:glycosyltransferase family 2 protein [Parasphingorhabdus sp. NYA22]